MKWKTGKHKMEPYKYRRGEDGPTFTGCLACGHDLETETFGRYRHLETTNTRDQINRARQARGLEPIE